MLTSQLWAETLVKSIPMQISAVIKNGCILNGSVTSGVSLGTIRFGAVALNQPAYAISSENAGSVMLQCTPGTQVSIALNAGKHANNIEGGRKLRQANTGDTLLYQLYQDAAYTKIWGNNVGSSLSMTATGGKDTLIVYAKLMPIASFPSAGSYQDTVTVTVTY
jgi:spore coat protein U-like protein